MCWHINSYYYIESASGVAEGGRTGLTALTTGILFIVVDIFSYTNNYSWICNCTGISDVGLFMISVVTKIDFEDFTEVYLLSRVNYHAIGGIDDGLCSG